MAIIHTFRACMKRLDERLVGHALRIAQLRWSPQAKHNSCKAAAKGVVCTSCT